MDKRTGDRPSAGRTNPASRRPSSSGVGSPFVGRAEELRRLSATLALAAEGQGGAIFLTGQPGIGKTRLARESLAAAQERGFTVLEGRAYPLGVGLAYAPILDAFDPLLRRCDADRLASLVSGLPDLGRLFGGLNLPSPEPLGDHALEKTRLFWAVSRLIERLTQGSPVALFIDDLHRADSASLEMLHYLARCLAGQRFLLLATYGDNSLDASPVLQALVGPLQRDGLAEEIVVPRLGRGAIDQLVRGILGGETPGELLDLLDARAGGEPLFVESLIAALIDSGNLIRTDHGWVLDADGAAALPPGVRRLIRDRLGWLGMSDRRVLDLIAVLGDATSHTILCAASGLDEDILVEALRRLRDAGLVAEGTAGADVAYSITHPLIQEVVYAELPAAGRRRAHRAAIEALERIRPDDVSRLARHYRGAGGEADRDRAVGVLIAAGKHALAQYANHEAARHFHAALIMVRGGQTGGTDPREGVPWLLEQLGEAWERIGKREAAVEAWGEALAERERTGNIVAASGLRTRLALAEWDRGHFDVANAHLGEALAALVGREPCQELADLHLARSDILVRLGDVAGMADTAAELLIVAKKVGSPRAEAEAHFKAASFCLWQGDVINAREHALRALMLAEQAKELAICCRGRGVLATISMYLGDHKLMRCHAEEGLAVAQRVGMPHMEVLLHLHLAFANFIAGDGKESQRCCMKAIAQARRIGYPRDLAYALASRALILAQQGDLPEAEACIFEAREAFASGPSVDRYLFGILDIAEMTVALGRGQAKSAPSIVRSFASASVVGTALAGLVPWFKPVGLMVLAEAQVVAGEAESALDTAGKLIGLGPTGTPYFTALASRVEGLARQAMGEWEAAITCLMRAHEAFTALEMPFEAAKTLLEQAAVTAVVQPKAAAIAAQRSLTTFEHLGVQRYADRARRLLRALGISPRAPRRSRRGSGLSERELEIARLAAEGLTTAIIAERLILSPSTVATHLHHIYTRLDISSRTALAKYITDTGPLSPVKNT